MDGLQNGNVLGHVIMLTRVDTFSYIGPCMQTMPAMKWRIKKLLLEVEATVSSAVAGYKIWFDAVLGRKLRSV